LTFQAVVILRVTFSRNEVSWKVHSLLQAQTRKLLKT
jgi:hypothetical protein